MSPLRISVVIIGRNDDYEVGWADHLERIIAYNRAAAASEGIVLEFVFVEWNPPGHRPLLAPGLTSRNADLVCVVVPHEVHAEMGSTEDLPIVLAVAVNTGIRAASGDFVLVTGGDIFFGRDLLARIARDGLHREVLYRGERVNIAPMLPWDALTPGVVEDPARIESVDACTEAPYDAPPFTNACGDFLMADRITMLGLRGLDESVRHSRLHLDSRFALNAMFTCERAVLLGRIFHVSHSRSFVNAEPSAYAGRRINPYREVPYLNDPGWGLGSRPWEEAPAARVWRVGTGESRTGGPPTHLSWRRRRAMQHVVGRLEEACAGTQPSAPPADASGDARDMSTALLKSYDYWPGASTMAGPEGVRVTTPPDPWAYSSMATLTFSPEEDRWAWVWVDFTTESGSVAIGLLDDGKVLEEEVRGAGDAPQRVWMRIKAPDPRVLIRNAERASQTVAVIHGLGILNMAKSEADRDG